ncbi:GntR family transcriptional regulator [Paraburkholderia bryophila]|uniref:GntR family transcriptional regulator n=1 Tax=Paraburkholderia bryophila TaxID=420952 RepID=A0A329CUA5_9BURK|nr:GntR family transcriptional regulator [Paraburkholderia bryophila]RAS37412.1 GntR family transcriptional regulator [Paraburkholderia bryophila]
MKTSLHQTLQDQTYDTLRQWLTIGRFVPGERIKIRHVAAELGVGEMPVRAALQRLAAESALVNVPNCGVTVPRLCKAQFDDVLRVRLILEGQAAELGVPHLTSHELATLAQLNAQMIDALRAANPKCYLDANEAFHLILYRAAGSPLLLDLIETVWLQVGPISNLLFGDAHFAGTLNDAHDELLNAATARDAAGVRRAIERDLSHAAICLREQCD